MAVYHGKKGVVYMSTTGSGDAGPIIKLTEWSLNMPADRVEVTNFDSDNKEYVQGFKDISGSLAGFWDDTSDDLYDASESDDGVKMYLYPSSLVESKYFYGTAWVDFSISTGVGGAVSVSADYAAAGAWGQV
jgi:hypothetical protein